MLLLQGLAESRAVWKGDRKAGNTDPESLLERKPILKVNILKNDPVQCTNYRKEHKCLQPFLNTNTKEMKKKPKQSKKKAKKICHTEKKYCVYYILYIIIKQN